MAATEKKKVLWIFPNNTAGVLLATLIPTVIVAFIWQWVERLDFSKKNAWIMIVEMLLLALIVGGIHGMNAGNAKQSTLWTAAGFAWVGTVLTGALAAAAGATWDAALLGGMGADAFSSASVSVGALVIGIVAAVAATAGSKRPM